MIDTRTSGPGYYYKTYGGTNASLRGLLLHALLSVVRKCRLLTAAAEHHADTNGCLQTGLSLQGAPVTERDLSSSDHFAIAKHSHLVAGKYKSHRQAQ